jgi:hypothetical protein
VAVLVSEYFLVLDWVEKTFEKLAVVVAEPSNNRVLS